MYWKVEKFCTRSVIGIGRYMLSIGHQMSAKIPYQCNTNLMSQAWPTLPGLPPPYLHIASDQRLEVGTAWERGNTTSAVAPNLSCGDVQSTAQVKYSILYSISLIHKPTNQSQIRTWSHFPVCAESAYYYYISYWVHSNSCIRMLLAMAKWTVLAKERPEVSLGRLDQLLYQAGTLFLH